ncbi:NAD(P)H-binding protein [Saccharothrix longispora]|uniref:NmrA family NAD(P)-binding protein n=1 Tax=Saccharothrix longispora TaxID=33920 RepID=UPI0028FD31A6|nr:NAD(P)H-binding protein [Saccharothrix longispora]MDU0287705.1 NAD(P)H-binding protein [Saccharothrix longispora]
MTTNKPILVLGGTGKTGKRVVARLRARGFTARAASRNGETKFDWHDESTWDAALDGAGAVYMVDLVDEAVEWDPAVSVRSFCKKAVAAGVERLTLLQARTDEEAGGKSLTGSEDIVRASGLRWTILRPTWFTQNFDEGVLLDSIMAGHLRAPAGDGLEPFIDCDDIAEVAVASLTEEGHAGQVYELTGPEAITFGQAVAEIARATGREIRYESVTHEQYVDDLVSVGTPREYAELLADLIGQIREGKNAYLSDGVRRALGREPISFAAYAENAAANGAWQA